IVPRSRLAETCDLAAAAAAKLPLGDPFDGAARLGPLVSREQVDRVRGFVTRALKDGARAVTGGPETPADLPVGFFFKPTILADVKPDMAIAQQEVFGPVLVIISYETEDEALAIANGTDYGLAGGVWSADKDRAVRFARRMRTGQIDINGGRFNPIAPF